MNRIVIAFSIWMTILVLGPATSGEIASTNGEFGRQGALDGVWLWRLPDTSNGLRPTQSWHATGSSPGGDIYVAGMDHATNAALYRLHSQTRKLELVGDARSSSEAVRNWLPGETAQKFHTRPLWHNGKIFVATMNRSTLDDQYLTVRGFHWYAYVPTERTFSDLSASEPGGAAVDHGNVVALASDPARNFVYAAGVPTGDIFRYDVQRGRTDRLGRPSAYDQPYVYTGRVMWVDSRGRLYFAAGSSKSPSVFNHIYYHDPETGFGERKDWLLPNLRGLELGQCVSKKQICFFSDDEGHIYRFDDNGPAWSYIGQIQAARPADGKRAYVWLFQVAPDASKAYVGTSVPFGDDPTALYEVDLRTAETERLCTFAELDRSLQSRNIHTGYDAWDSAGAFYFASFRGRSDQPVILTRVNPEQLKLELSKLAR
ncbi:hypothetical protein QCM80_42090 [Bradyrhizobium sp. SSUT112]|uniref:hypothetical protein n=1 Tax=Bradyrhizobium sp. SSUT112 TaxID=3040604 RepID=UPI00244AA126|nr:hypothetical protein [Bradyrhizobium sp. SSUT112]MDH2357129.1 hypothetical protein [Bradyrhizobium sp. SSUT112]